MKPSNFCMYPWSCVFRNSESETIALNVMKILKRTGDKWRSIEWDEYASERKKDGNFTPSEKKYFDKVAPYCDSPKNAQSFSPTWGKISNPKK